MEGSSMKVACREKGGGVDSVDLLVGQPYKVPAPPPAGRRTRCRCHLLIRYSRGRQRGPQAATARTLLHRPAEVLCSRSVSILSLAYCFLAPGSCKDKREREKKYTWRYRHRCTYKIENTRYLGDFQNCQGPRDRACDQACDQPLSVAYTRYSHL